MNTISKEENMNNRYMQKLVCLNKWLVNFVCLVDIETKKIYDKKIKGTLSSFICSLELKFLEICIVIL